MKGRFLAGLLVLALAAAAGYYYRQGRPGPEPVDAAEVVDGDWLEHLYSQNPKVAEEAARQLQRLGAGALPEIRTVLSDPGADLVVAALVLNVQAQGRQLRAVLTALARSSRSELEARRRIEADRRAVRRGVQVVVLVTVVMALGLLTLNPAYVAPYREPVGQVVLGAVVAIFAVGFAWLRRLAEFRPPGRFLELSAQAAGRSTTWGLRS